MGRMNLMNSAYLDDPQPIDCACICYTCQHYSRAYLRHLILAKEVLSATLLSIHNIHTLVQLAGDMRAAIVENRFGDFIESLREEQNEGNR